MTPKYEPDTSHWHEEAGDEEDPVSIDSHRIDIIHVRDPDETMGYGRDKYTIHFRHDNRLVALYATKHKWKGNYWRDNRLIDWRDVPEPVQRQAAAAVGVDVIDTLATDQRLIPEGGESTYKRLRDEVGPVGQCDICGGDVYRDEEPDDEPVTHTLCEVSDLGV